MELQWCSWKALRKSIKHSAMTAVVCPCRRVLLRSGRSGNWAQIICRLWLSCICRKTNEQVAIKFMPRGPDNVTKNVLRWAISELLACLAESFYCVLHSHYTSALTEQKWRCSNKAEIKVLQQELLFLYVPQCASANGPPFQSELVWHTQPTM